MTMRAYPRYKDSGVEWLGQVPEHWMTTQLRRVTDDKSDGPFGSGLKSEHYRDEGARVIRLQNIRSYAFDDGDAAFIDLDYFRNDLQGHDVQPGDLLIAGLGDDRNTVGRACVAPEAISPALVKADCFRFRLKESQINSKFAAYQLSASAAFDAGILSSGSTRSRIALYTMAGRVVVLPPLPEQAAIAAFLDWETAKIDALVAEQRRLIELLTEKRRTVISHAVTKGLNPDTPMKHSGIEWLGKVPEHWEVTPLKYLVSICGGSTPSKAREDFWDGSVPWASSKDMKADNLSDTIDHLTTIAIEESGIQLLDPGSILVVVRGMILAHTFPVCINQIPMCINQDLKALRPYQHLRVDFLADFLRGTAAISLSRVDHAAHGTTVLRLNDWVSLSIAVPPINEQREISVNVRSSTSEIDSLIAAAEAATRLLHERRTALISAAVTGKIDVRGSVPATPEEVGV